MRRDNVVALLQQTNFVARHEASRAPAAKAKAWLMERLRGRRTQQERLDDAADAVEERLRVAVIGNELIDVQFQWSDPELTFEVVQAAIQSFLDARRAADVSSIGETIAILEEHAARVDKEVAEQTTKVENLERELVASKRARGIFRRPRAVRDVELARLEARLAAKRRTLAVLQEVRERRLAELQTELQQQEVVYAERHPALEATRRSMQALSTRTTQLEKLRGEIAELEREASQRGSLLATPLGKSAPASTRTDIVLDPDEDPRLEYERHQLWLLVRQHAGLIERIDSARVVMDTARVGFKYRYTIVKPPRMPKGHVKPDVPRVLLAGIVGGLLFAFCACAILDLLRGLLVERWQVERLLGLAVLAEQRPPR